MSPGTYGEHRRFCELDGWESRETDHFHYSRCLSDGRFLRTRVSHGKSSTQYGRALWSQILKQLDVTEDKFYETLDSRKPVDRRVERPERPPGPVLPLWLYENLLSKVGMASDEIGQLSEVEAMERWIEWQAKPND